MKNFPWLRSIAVLAIAGFAYHQFTKEPIVYQDMNVTQAYAGADTLSDHHLRLEGVPFTSNYFYGDDAPFSDKHGISFVLRGEGDSNILCYASNGSANEEADYSRCKAFIDYHANEGNRLRLEGQMKKGYFEFRVPDVLEKLLAN